MAASLYGKTLKPGTGPLLKEDDVVKVDMAWLRFQERKWRSLCLRNCASAPNSKVLPSEKRSRRSCAGKRGALRVGFLDVRT